MIRPQTSRLFGQQGVVPGQSLYGFRSSEIPMSPRPSTLPSLDHLEGMSKTQHEFSKTQHEFSNTQPLRFAGLREEQTHQTERLDSLEGRFHALEVSNV